MKKLIYLTLPFLLTVAACSKKEDPAPAPVPAAVASFTMARTVAEVSESVQLTNTSTGAVRYEWSTSSNSTGISTAGVFQSATLGTFTITLKAYNSAGVATTSSQSIRMGQRILTEVLVTAIPLARPNGQPWRPGGATRTALTIDGSLSRGGRVVFTNSPIPTVIPDLLPITWPVPSSTTVEITDGVYNIVFFDNPPASAPTSMFNDYITIIGPPSNRDANGTGSYRYTTPSGWAMTFFTTIR